MQTCGCGGKSCNGILQKSDPRKIVNGQVYSPSCGFKVEKESKKLFCSHCFKPIDRAYSTILLKQIRLDFHPGCEYLFKKDVKNANRIP